MIRIRTRDLTVVCEFIFSELLLHLGQKKKPADYISFNKYLNHIPARTSYT